MWRDRISNVYFHLDIECLKNFDQSIKEEDITMKSDLFAKISDAHMDYLNAKGLLEHIVENTAKVNLL